MLDILGEDYVRTARARVGEATVMIGHVLGNSLVPIITVLGPTMAVMIGGTVVTETVFNLPGVGNLVVRGAAPGLPVIQGTLLVIAAIYVFINFSIDIIYTLVDPRIRLRAPHDARQPQRRQAVRGPARTPVRPPRRADRRHRPVAAGGRRRRSPLAVRCRSERHATQQRLGACALGAGGHRRAGPRRAGAHRSRRAIRC